MYIICIYISIYGPPMAINMSIYGLPMAIYMSIYGHRRAIYGLPMAIFPPPIASDRISISKRNGPSVTFRDSSPDEIIDSASRAGPGRAGVEKWRMSAAVCMFFRGRRERGVGRRAERAPPLKIIDHRLT